MKITLRNTRLFGALAVTTTFSLLGCQASLDKDGARGSTPGGTTSPTGSGPSAPGTVPDFGTQNPGSAPLAGGQLADEPLVMRRLTNTEYDNTVRDLLGATLPLAHTFPPEERARGFNNNALALSYPAQLAEKSYSASGQIAKRVSASLEAFVPCASTPTQACAREFISAFGQQAWRRPLTNEEVERLVRVFDVGARRSFARGIELVVTSLTIGAPFWYRVEFGDGQDVPGKPGMVRPTSWEMAARLSYLAWNSTPDASLLGAAAQDALKSPEQVKSAFEQLLADARAHQAVANFNDQWLQIYRAAAINKDPTAFPAWKLELREFARKELELFADHVAWNTPRGFEALFTSNASFLNSELASVYGVNGVSGSDFRAATLGSTNRSGFFSRVGFLALEGFDQTSPVRRAAFIRRFMLCQDPPPPPANVDNTPVPKAATNTTRDRNIAHTTNPQCAACHQLLDPLGFGLESYDAIGQYRTTENGLPVDDTGIAYQSDIGEFKGAVELGQKFSTSAQAQQCFAQQFYRFAFGRSPSEQRFESVTKLVGSIQATGGNYTELLRTMVTLDEFLYRPKSPT